MSESFTVDPGDRRIWEYTDHLFWSKEQVLQAFNFKQNILLGEIALNDFVFDHFYLVDIHNALARYYGDSFVVEEISFGGEIEFRLKRS